MKVKTGGKCPLPLPAALDVLRKRAEVEMGQLTPWEKVAAETLHSKLTVFKVWTWFKSLRWEAAKSLAGDSEQILQLRPDYLDQKQLGKGQPQASLHIKHPSVELFYDGLYFAARYGTVNVAASSKEAEGCRGWVEVLGSGHSFPLHWAGTPVTSEEAGAPPIAIRPGRPAALDVAVALPPPGKMEKPSPPFKVRGEVAGMVAHTSWDGEGCWLAQPAALDNPHPLIESYLPPGEYRIKISVGCKGGVGASRKFLLRSPDSWETLELAPG